LEPLKKGVIVKMAYLVELESELVKHALHDIFVVWIWKFYKKYYRIYSNQQIWYYLIWICYEYVMTFLPETPVLD
jgi:hypothetical protein